MDLLAHITSLTVPTIRALPWIDILPIVNASMNGAATVLLVSALIAIKRRRIHLHARLMITAFITSSLFLVCYLAHKFVLYHVTGKTNHASGLPPGLLKNFYLFVILLPHLVLAVVMLPMIIITFRRAYHRRWDAHRRLARPTFWIWLYVSITGVVIYWMLYHLFPTIAHA